MEPTSPEMPVMPHSEMLHHQDLNKKIFMALILASSVLLFILLFISCCWIYRLKFSKKSGSDRDSCNSFSNLRVNQLKNSLEKCSVKSIDYETLKSATNNFHESKILNQNGNVRVYKACFSDKRQSAVKRMEVGEKEKDSEFENEASWMTKIHHKNIISFLGYCIYGETKYLVYEMMENGSLENQLHGPSHGSSLSWSFRIKIAVDIAKALEYLHEHCNPPVVHNNLKSSTIFLDSKFNAKLSHFGRAMTFGVRSKKIKLSGTTGYLAPECHLDGKLTDKSDVYAFGVVLLELLTGRRSIIEDEDNSESLVNWALPCLSNRSKLSSIVDSSILGTMDLRHLYQIAAVAVLCVQNEPSYRPLITDVLHSLIPLVPLELGGSLRVTEPSSAVLSP